MTTGLNNNILKLTKTSPKTKLSLFKVFIRPHCEYGAPLCNLVNDTINHKITTMQNKFLRYNFGLPKIRTEDLLKNTNMIPIRTRIGNLSNKWYEKAKLNNEFIRDYIGSLRIDLGVTPDTPLYKIIHN